MHLPKEYLIFCGLSSNSLRIMEQPQAKRKVSAVWDHFDLISENKVKCRICSTELSYLNKSTSMLRPYRARHENEVPDTPRINSASSFQVADAG
ncbi:hypothetical protein XENORESO_013269 [Xenotaenia resolanae]|uniref:BED-type domain-containing protein n=1 Tax=Xenotaenia resolanae TaxID=208358 RepID=A0ABV0WEW7_9TELE